MEYESFLRWAFGLPLGIHLDRYGDPAKAADTDSFTLKNLESVKAATAYAMMIYWNDIVAQTHIPQSDHDKLQNYVKEVLDSSSLDNISNLTTSFNEFFVNKYYKRSNGKITFHASNNESL